MNKDPIWKHILILHGNTYFIVYCDIRPFQSEANKRYIHIISMQRNYTFIVNV